MRRTFFLSLVVLNALFPVITKGQQTGSPVVVSLPNGGFAAFKIEVTSVDVSLSGRKQSDLSFPPFTPKVVPGMDNILHRLLIDEQGRLVFGYDLIVTNVESLNRFSISARALDPAFAQTLQAQDSTVLTTGASFNPPTLAHATGQQTVTNGETVALDLLVSDSLGLKVVDFVTVASERFLLFPTNPSAAPRDFALNNVELAIRNYQLYVDNRPVVTSRGLRNCRGALIWFSLPGQGRFIFSLVPYHEYDFRKIGVIQGNKISFTWKGVNYEWVSRDAIVGSGGFWNLWVLHDPDYLDIFDQPLPNSEKKVAETGPRLFPKPVGVPIPLPKNTEPATLTSHQSKKPSPERVRVVIGAAKRIETLLLKQ